jgi:hypothetical protein
MAGLINYVPVVRKTLEALIFRVKGMLVANNSPDAFWMGNLKNKTIRGEEILTQVGILCEISSFLCLSQYCHLVQPGTIQKVYFIVFSFIVSDSFKLLYFDEVF